MNAIFGVTDKRINSTKQTFTQQKTLDVKLKDDCSMRSPVFKVKGLTKGTLYNYVKWEDRYYYIQDIIYKTFDIQEVHCTIDTLATFRDSIIHSPMLYYILYSSREADWDKQSDDPRFQPQIESSHEYNLDLTGLIPGLDVDEDGNIKGSVIIRHMDTGSKDAGVYTTAIGVDNFFKCLADLSGLSTQSMAALICSIGCSSWRDNILSCVWVPFSMDSLPGQDAEGFYLGNVPCAAGLWTKYLDPVVIMRDHPTIDLTSVWPSVDLYAAFTKNPRWMRITIETPIGTLVVPTDYLRDNPTIYVESIKDVCSGDITLKFSEDQWGLGTPFGTLNGNLSVDLMGFVGTGESKLSNQIGVVKAGAEIGLNLYSMGKGIGAFRTMRSLSQIMPMLPYLPNAGQTIANIQDNYDRSNMAMQTVGTGINDMSSLPGSVTGSCGGGSAVGVTGLWACGEAGRAQCVVERFVPSKDFDQPNVYKTFCEEWGFPANRVGSLSSRENYYVQCTGASFLPDSNFKGTADDVSTINSFLNSGVYLE